MYFLQDYQARISVFQQWNHVSQESYMYMYMSNTFKYVGGFFNKKIPSFKQAQLTSKSNRDFFQYIRLMFDHLIAVIDKQQWENIRWELLQSM